MGHCLLVLFLLLDGEAESAEFVTQSIVFAVGVGDGVGVVELESACAFVDEGFLGIDSHHVGYEHVVAPQRADFGNAAFDVQGTLGDEGRLDLLCGLGCKVEVVELVVVASAAHATPVGGLGERLGGEVDDELARATDEVVGVALTPEGDVAHRRVAADGAGPCHGDNVVVVGAVATRNHDRRERIKECAGLEGDFHDRRDAVVNC